MSKTKEKKPSSLRYTAERRWEKNKKRNIERQAKFEAKKKAKNERN